MPSSAKQALESWNRRLHYYLGLYFLFFLWLFLLSGLMLNHGSWPLWRGIDDRVETRFDRAATVPDAGTNLERARSIVQQLGLTGEIEWPNAQPAGQFTFSIARPRDASQVRVDLAQRRAFVVHYENNRLAVFRIFHTFSGSKYNAPGGRDWGPTTAWVIAMDALAIGLIVMVLGSYYMWWRLKKRHGLGLAALAAGFVCCALFFRTLL